MIGIRFNGFHSLKDKNITLRSRSIGRPSKEKNKRKPAFSNTEYDFSRLYGSETYTTRLLTYSFNIIETDKNKLSYRITEIVNWLMDSEGKQPLDDDAIPGYHFLAEVEKDISIEENWLDAVVTAEFVAYPFIIKNVPEGTPYWDDYTVYDVYQITEYEVSGSQTVTIYNTGIADSIPEVIASSDFKVIKDNRTFIIPSGNLNNS